MDRAWEGRVAGRDGPRLGYASFLFVFGGSAGRGQDPRETNNSDDDNNQKKENPDSKAPRKLIRTPHSEYFRYSDVNRAGPYVNRVFTCP